MVVSVSSNVTTFEEKLSIKECSLLPTTNIDQHGYELAKKHHLRPEPFIDTGNEYSLVGDLFQVKDHPDKIEGMGFSFNNPWLPSNTLKLLNKLKKGPISETELVRLMELVAERASLHFQLSEGSFVAMTFNGRIVEASNTRIGLLKKIQGRKYREQIFVWRIGSNAFSDRT